MPQRKKPFSAKQKKEQLKTKREKKRTQDTDEYGRPVGKRNQTKAAAVERDSSDDEDDQSGDVSRLNQQPQKSEKGDKRYDPNRYRLHFAKDSDKEVQRRKEETRNPYQMLPEAALEMDIAEVYRPGSVLDMPKRPSWNYSLSKAALDAREEAYFKSYLDSILAAHDPAELSYFELNLETWRQLWRVLEMADIVLLIADIRHPALHFSPALYHFVTRDLSRPMILVLNKCDLAPPGLVTAWRAHVQELYPDITVVCFTSYPRKPEAGENEGTVLNKRRRRRPSTAVGQTELLEACEKIVQGKVDLSSWREKMEGEVAGTDSGHQVELRLENTEDYTRQTTTERYKDGVLTIGCCGYPNVGKSSLMNGLMGKKVVSVSKTPGHTKHFQTIFLTPTVKLCDSPGLVFPSLVHKPLQILSGIYPIAQVREPYSAIQYLAERLPLVEILKVRHPEDDGKSEERRRLEWSAFDICDAWAEKRGYLTAKAARNDTYRAANQLLRLAVDGRLCLCMRPPGYTRRKDYWESHEDTVKFAAAQISHSRSEGGQYNSQDSEEDEEGVEGNSQEDEEEEDVDSENELKENSSQKQKSVGVSNPFLLLADD